MLNLGRDGAPIERFDRWHRIRIVGRRALRFVRFNAGAVVLATAVLVLQIWPLLWRRPFYIDWVNHTWLVNYYAVNLSDNYAFTTEIDTAHGTGNPAPLFYGLFFYPIISLLALATGADMAVRLFCAFMLLSTFLAYLVFFRTMTGNLQVSILLSCCVNGSIYQLSNLYARSALTEFAAHQFLLLSFVLILAGLSQRDKQADASLSLGVVCGLFGMGSHPVTLYLFCIFGVANVVWLLWAFRGYFHRVQLIKLGLACAVGVGMLSGWLIITAQNRGDFVITNLVAMMGRGPPRLGYLVDTTDSVLGKLGILLFEARAVVDGIGATSTPFLDAPLNVALMVCVALMLMLLAPRLKMIGLSAFVPSLLISGVILYFCFPLSRPQMAAEDLSFIYTLLAPIQAAYRLVNGFALAMTLVLLIAVLVHGRSSFGAKKKIWLSYAAFFVLIATAQKTYVTYVEYIYYPPLLAAQPQRLGRELANEMLAMKPDDYFKIIADTTRYPPTFASANDYASIRFEAYDPNDGRQRLNVSLLKRQPVPVVCERACAMQTDVMLSRFSEIQIDGAPAAGVRAGYDFKFLILADAGPHTIEIRKTGLVGTIIRITVFASLAWLFLSIFWFAIASALKIFGRTTQSADRQDMPLGRGQVGLAPPGN